MASNVFNPMPNLQKQTGTRYSDWIEAGLMFGPMCPPSCFLTKCFDHLFVTYVASHTVSPPTQLQRYQKLHEGGSSNRAERRGAPGVCGRSRLVQITAVSSSRMQLLWTSRQQQIEGSNKSAICPLRSLESHGSHSVGQIKFVSENNVICGFWRRWVSGNDF